MEKEIRVLIADGDEDYRVLMSEYLCAGSGMCLAGSAGTADETVELLQSCRADVLLLDLLLPGRDGIYVLEKLRELPAPPAVVVNTSFCSAMLARKCTELKVSVLLQKPAEPELVLERLRFAWEFHGRPSRPAEPPCSQEERLKRELTGLLMRLNCTSRYKGYHYLRHAAAAAWRGGALERSVTKRLYPETARHFGVSSGSVERAIRTLAEHIWKCGGAPLLEEVLGVSGVRQAPTNTELIALLVDQLDRRLGDRHTG